MNQLKQWDVGKGFCSKLDTRENIHSLAKHFWWTHFWASLISEDVKMKDFEQLKSDAYVNNLSFTTPFTPSNRIPDSR